ncbi:MAG: Na+-transporting NADH:ubiquinone oxidoreductase subunit B [Rhodothermales bacterium]|jgi:Na+-transporting NADH:ubiquinone oxidoreductase subunit B
MKGIKEVFDSVRSHFEPGGKLERLYPVYEAHETFLFSPGHRTKSGSHVRDSIDSKRLMSTVIVALIPCVLFGIYNTGYQYYMAQGMTPEWQDCIAMGALYVAPVIIVSYAVGGIWELVFAVVRKHEINEGFLVTGLLFPLTLPPTIPLWQVALGISFGVVIGKEVFGGTGMNIFNPALVGRAFLFFAYPAQISGDRVWTVRGEQLVDGYSGATPLAESAAGGVNAIAELASAGSESTSQFVDFSLSNSFIGFIPGSIGETSTIACLIGAAILIITGVGSWRIMVSMCIGAFLMNLFVCQVATPENGFFKLSTAYHFVTGGFAFGCVFMATDPVSSAQTTIGKWIYGFLIGGMAIIVRCINPAYPEGVMMSILFMNAFAPLIDHYVYDAHIKRRKNRAKA